MFNPVLLHDYLSLSAAKYPEKYALVCEEERFTYKEFDDVTDNLAQALIVLGLKRHGRVIIYMDNCIEMAVAMFAVMKAGGIFVCLSGSVKSDRLRYTIKDSDAGFVILSSLSADEIGAAFSGTDNGGLQCRLIWTDGPAEVGSEILQNSFTWNDLISGHSPGSLLRKRKAEIIDYDLVTLVYTSGSTGEPKGVMCSHAAMLSVSQSVIQYLRNSDQDIVLSVLPLSFVYGLYQLIVMVITGGTLVLEKSFMFPNRIINVIQKESVTGLPIIPTIAALILKLHTLDSSSVSTLRYITNAGAGLPVEHIIKLRELFPQVNIYSMYGCAECLRIAYLPPDEIDIRPSSVGRAIPNCEVIIVDENDVPVGPGETGELVVRGSNVMRGYWNSPELTEKTFRRGIEQGGVWLHTGDYFRKDEDGYLYFVSRKDDIIKTAGKKVSPKEIENILYKLTSIQEAAVIGVEDKILGQAIKAFIVPVPDSGLKKSEIIDYCSVHLEKYLIPRYIEFVECLPKTLNGKIDKPALRKKQLFT